MTLLVRDSFVDLERHRLQLEENVAKLQASLQHWQAWEIEYEGMKEDLLGLGDGYSQDDLVGSFSRSCVVYDPDEPTQESLVGHADESVFAGQIALLDAKERTLLLRDEKGASRSKDQIIGLLSRRVDYVQQNIKSVSSLLHIAEDKYAASQVLSQPEVRNEEGLPLTEIQEELDEDGNIISSTTSKPGQTAPQLVEALSKAGVNVPTDHDAAGKEASGANSSTIPALDDNERSQEASKNSMAGERPGPQSSITSRSSHGNDTLQRPSRSRKRVSFATDTKEAVTVHAASGLVKAVEKQHQTPKSKPNGITDEVSEDNRKPEISLYDEEEDQPFNAVIPEDESPEDAALRRQMIQYNMNEINPIVAELDVDEDDDPYSDEDSQGEEYDTSSIEEDEDQFGRTKRQVLSSDYKNEMRKLEQRLKNVGPNATVGSVEPAKRLEKDQAASANPQSIEPAQAPEAVAKKGVRFVKELDIQQDTPESPRNDPVTANPSKNTSKSHKPTHAPTIIERPYSASSPSSAAVGPDEFDPALVRQEVSTEYHRMRNRMIQKQGGFMANPEDDESGEVPSAEVEGGGKKISRFKAARLGKLGS